MAKLVFNVSSRYHLSAESSALLLIDHQVGTMQLVRNVPLDDVVRRNPQELLLEAFESRIKRAGRALAANATVQAVYDGMKSRYPG